ncbi:DNA glycosylase AlkZ-like family protein [Haloechinothrix halophila]|uniref:DNA glycosylase AlkZ-like family protein n=1 Tax=Haloechinothrix halophila TaxID=1069073 RepID=UPI00055763EA|nr:crosslink repair DNA glycosylase YcaQ family protein [Haloechinothrix halophila]
MLSVDRAQVMAYRVAAQELHRPHGDVGSLTVLGLGVQDAQRGSARLALAARLDVDPGVLSGESFRDTLDAADVTLAWTHRGAPHLHHAAELPAVAASLVPLTDADAQARLAWQRGDVAKAGMPPTEALRTAASALHDVVDATMTKGAASERVTARVPEGLARWCRPCQATHIHEQVMRLTTLRAGLRLEPDVFPATLTPLGGGLLAEEPDPVACTGVAARYLHLHGPATTAETAGFIGTTKRVAGEIWPDDLVEVEFEGKRTWLAREDVAMLENPPEPDAVRLLPPSDPLLQARDRRTLVPDEGRHKQVWRVLGNPGVLLAAGEIVATWRAKAAGRNRLDVTLDPFLPLRHADRTAAEDEAARIAAVRGFPDVRVTVS